MQNRDAGFTRCKLPALWSAYAAGCEWGRRVTGAPGQARHRLDIQALRALAVALVVLWHAGLPGIQGGFIGVDVFFVISGFLMVQLLVREVDRSDNLRVGAFYYRRARRLLPVALTVLGATLLMTWLILPSTAWRSLGLDVVASAFYVVNWRLAVTEVDYLAADSLPSPVQHYWSLSVEEQFYILLPLALLTTLWLGRRIRAKRRDTSPQSEKGRHHGLVALIVLGVPSLVWSLLAADALATGNYFSTAQRVWELCLGGVIALLPAWSGRRSRTTRLTAAVIGLGGIVVSATQISPDVAYPGGAAIFPCLASAMLLWADCDRLADRGAWRVPWVQWLGDRSYSVYLWHWPLLLAAYTLYEGQVVAVVGAVGLTLLVSELSFRHIEQRFRARSPRMPSSVGAPAQQPATRSVAVLVTVTMLTGAGGLLLASARDDGHLTPPVAAATDDRFMDFYDGDCRPDIPETNPLTCTFGDPRGNTRILVVGDSHAVMWMPGLIAAGAGQGWQMDLQAKLSCAPVGVPIDLRGNPYTACAEWGRNVLRGIEQDPPDVVVLALNPGYLIVGTETDPSLALAQALRATVQQIRRSGPQVVLMGVTPRFPGSVPECLAAPEQTRSSCSAVLPDAVPENHWTSVTEGIDGARILDLTDSLCPEGLCLTDAHGILRWMDSNHMTATFARSLGPELRTALSDLAKDSDADAAA